MCSSDLFDCLRVNDYSRLSVANAGKKRQWRHSVEDSYVHKTAVDNTAGNMWKALCVLLIFVQVYCFCLNKYEKTFLKLSGIAPADSEWLSLAMFVLVINQEEICPWKMSFLYCKNSTLRFCLWKERLRSYWVKHPLENRSSDIVFPLWFFNMCLWEYHDACL